MRTRREPPAVVGLDLSLTGPAAVAIPPRWVIGMWSALYAWTREYPPIKEGYEVGRAARLVEISAAVEEFILQVSVRRSCPVVVYVENYAFQKRSSSVTKLAELGGAVRARLYQRAPGLVPIPVVAASARKLLLGKLPQKEQKYAVQAAVFAAGAPKEWTEDVVDAFVVSNAGLSDLGFRHLCLFRGDQHALDSVTDRGPKSAR